MLEVQHAHPPSIHLVTSLRPRLASKEGCSCSSGRFDLQLRGQAGRGQSVVYEREVRLNNNDNMLSSVQSWVTPMHDKALSPPTTVTSS